MAAVLLRFTAIYHIILPIHYITFRTNATKTTYVILASTSLVLSRHLYCALFIPYSFVMKLEGARSIFLIDV